MFEKVGTGIPGTTNSFGTAVAETTESFANLDDTTKTDATMELPNDNDTTDSSIGILSQKVEQPIRLQRFSSFEVRIKELSTRRSPVTSRFADYAGPTTSGEAKRSKAA